MLLLPHWLTRYVSPVNDGIVSSHAFDITPAPILAANETIYSRTSHMCGEYRAAGLNYLLESTTDYSASQFATKVLGDCWPPDHLESSSRCNITVPQGGLRGYPRDMTRDVSQCKLAWSYPVEAA